MSDSSERKGWKHGDKCLVVFEGTIDALYSSGVMVKSDGRYIQAKWGDLKRVNTDPDLLNGPSYTEGGMFK